MSYKKNTRYGGKGAPPTKPKVEGGYRRIYCELRRDNNNLAVKRPAGVAFGGLTEDLKGQIYNMGTGSQLGQFIANTKDLASYSGFKCTGTQEIRIAIEPHKGFAIPIPTKRTYIDE